MKRIWISGIIVVLLLWHSTTARATHIQGGEIFYVHLGNNQYQFTLHLYQDCLNGEPAAIADDNPAKIGVFTGNGQRIWIDSFFVQSIISVPTNFSNSCINNPPNTCLRRATFIFNATLPPRPDGYRIIYQRCCRNNSILNVEDPQNTGATYFATIPPNVPNNTAVFKNYPPQIICVNNPLTYDHSATDPDGDSLSYELCEAYNGGGPNAPKPVPTLAYGVINYRNPYTPQLPMDGNPGLQIDPVTGMMNATPTLQGRYVVTVCCHEWRNGQRINTTKREFQFVVTNCSKAVVANIPQLSSDYNTYVIDCEDYTVQFQNTSNGATTYHWDFGVDNENADTSTDFEPTYTFPDTGVYQVKLHVNKGSTCQDSIMRLVKIYPEFDAKFGLDGTPCPGSPFSFVDSSKNSFPPTTYFQWQFGDGSVSNDPSPQYSFTKGGEFEVVYTSGNDKGCRDTAVRLVSIYPFKPFAGADTTIVIGQKINFNAQGGDLYQWSPGTYLSSTNISNPSGHFTDLGVFKYEVQISTETGCSGIADIVVEVVPEASFFVPTAFSPNNDGLNDRFRFRSVGYASLKDMRIFNRFGEMMFESNRLHDSWDGTYKGLPAPIGTYFWMVRVTDYKGQEQLLKGDVNLLR